uniref:Phosphatidylinositol-glycan biosynthesis class X protein n=1 Tax=Oryzias latipes TaxID=8090 RepID=A0A3P9HC43_ORYLA
MYYLRFYLFFCSAPCVYLIKEGNGDQEPCFFLKGLQPSLYVELSPKGFHRDVVTTVELGSETPADVRALLVYRWPRDVYVDPYQVASLSHQRGWQMLFNTAIDLEEPAHRTSEFSTYVYPSHAGPTPNPLKVTIPIHGRYHKPSFDGKTFTPVHIELPELLLWTKKCTPFQRLEPHTVLDAPCTASNTSICSWVKIQNPNKNSVHMSLHLPVGDGSTVRLICAGTLVVTLICCVVLCHSMLKHQLR